MCGIIGYVGYREAAPVLLEGLRCLEYRGYDSAGIAVLNGHIQVVRAKGKINQLAQRLTATSIGGRVGIGHTRWATHGKPSDVNAHPHGSPRVSVVHNGIIENHIALRQRLSNLGYCFKSETDTEIIPLLIDHYLDQSTSFVEAIRKTIGDLSGAFAFAAICVDNPETVVVVRHASPLVLGLGDNENLVASDIAALLDYTQLVLPLEDGEMAVLSGHSIEMMDFSGCSIDRAPTRIPWSKAMAEKEGYKHFMLKEIFEQPRAVADALRGRLSNIEDKVDLSAELGALDLARVKRVVLIACGTSWHAALIGKFWLEQLVKICVEVDLASEFRYRDPLVDSSVLFVAISQSGETADTLAALTEARRRGAQILSVCNVLDSTIARKSDAVLYLHAGPEIGVASTKAFTTQLTVLALFAIYFAEVVKQGCGQRLVNIMRSLPVLMEQVLQLDGEIATIARKYLLVSSFLFLGRGTSFPIALEGALKLKELSYLHAEGYAAGEMKHGPIALIDESVPVLVLASGGMTLDKTLSNIEEIHARAGQVIAVVTQGDTRLVDLAQDLIAIPSVPDFIRPIIEVVPLQLLAYHMADQLGKDVDQPRNLAKSVTVE